MLHKTRKEQKNGEVSGQVRQLVSVAVPAYNEGTIIKKNLNELCKYLATIENEFDWELVVVDDGSSDDTGSIADDFARRNPKVRVLHHVANFQLGQALRTAFANCHGEFIVTMDMDLTYSPDHIGRMIQTSRDTRAEIVIASPYMKGGEVRNIPWLRKQLSVVANRFLAFACRENLRTITGMVRAYKRRFLVGLDLKAKGVDINTEIIHKAAILQARIVEIPACLDWGALRGTGRRSSMRMMSSIAWNLLAGFMFRPFVFYIILGLVFFFLSLYPLGWAVAHSIQFYRSFPPEYTVFGYRFSEAVAEAFRLSPHSFVVGGFVLLAAVQMLSLAAMALQSHRYFKDMYHMTSRIFRCVKGGADDWNRTCTNTDNSDNCAF